MVANDQVFRLQGHCTLPHIQERRDALLEILSGDGDISLSIAHVESADISFVQLIVSALNTVKRQGRRLFVIDVPVVISDVFRSAGIDVSLLARI